MYRHLVPEKCSKQAGTQYGNGVRGNGVAQAGKAGAEQLLLHDPIVLKVQIKVCACIYMSKCVSMCVHVSVA